MKKINFFHLINLCVISLLLAGCCRSNDDFWDDTKTAGRHMSRGFKSLGGKHGDSRQVCSREEFMCYSDEVDFYDLQAMDFIPLVDEEQPKQLAMADTKTSKEPGGLHSHIPGIEAFSDPKSEPELADTFKNLQFPYNSSLVKGKNNMDVVRNIADYLKKNPVTYLFVEGHCDERGAEAYNLALGARRANSVRNLLIKNGVSSDNVFTVSYGKEKPLESGHSEEVWLKNRRAEFKVYTQL